MGYVLGMGIVFYVIYAVFALIFKHVLGWIIATALGFVAGILTLVASGSFEMLISIIIVACFVWFLTPIHIKDTCDDKISEDEENIVESDDSDDEDSM